MYQKFRKLLYEARFNYYCVSSNVWWRLAIICHETLKNQELFERCFNQSVKYLDRRYNFIINYDYGKGA